MASFALDLVLWLAGIRGHIPRFDDFRPVPATGTGHLMRILAIMAIVLTALSLAVWGTVWMAIRLL